MQQVTWDRGKRLLIPNSSSHLDWMVGWINQHHDGWCRGEREDFMEIGPPSQCCCCCSSNTQTNGRAIKMIRIFQGRVSNAWRYSESCSASESWWYTCQVHPSMRILRFPLDNKFYIEMKIERILYGIVGLDQLCLLILLNRDSQNYSEEGPKWFLMD